jgi:glycosyltransferase involved in cell wall biosynthesis
VAQRDMPSVYRSMDCFVLATRGEGWGRPIAEAMAMGLPAIATAWSGPTEFMNKSNSYPLDFTLRAGQREFARQCR